VSLKPVPDDNGFNAHGFEGLLPAWKVFWPENPISSMEILEKCSEGPVEMNLEKRDIVLEELKDFLDSIRTGRESLVSGEEGRKDIEVCLAGYKSVKEGKVINLPLIPILQC